MMEKTRTTGKVLGNFNSTCMALIPKADNPSSLEDFRPISLYNCIYKIVSKVIAKRVKRLLRKSVSEEQFRFLDGRQIHEAIDFCANLCRRNNLAFWKLGRSMKPLVSHRKVCIQLGEKVEGNSY